MRVWEEIVVEGVYRCAVYCREFEMSGYVINQLCSSFALLVCAVTRFLPAGIGCKSVYEKHRTLIPYGVGHPDDEIIFPGLEIVTESESAPK